MNPTRHVHTEGCAPTPGLAHVGHCEHCGAAMLPSWERVAGGPGVCARPWCITDRAAAPRSGVASATRATPGAVGRPVQQRPATVRRTSEQRATEEAVRAKLRKGNPPALLEMLIGSHIPRSKAKLPGGQQVPATMYCNPAMPPIVDLVFTPIGWSFQRPYEGPVTVVDRNAAWVSAFSTVRAAYGEMEHTGALDLPETGALDTGFYCVRIERWDDPTMPDPLSGRDYQLGEGDHVWVSEPMVTLLRDLARDGRWGGGSVEVTDSWTYPVAVRLTDWAEAVRDLRVWVMDEFGNDSKQYDLMKDSYAQAMQIITGTPNPGGPRTYATKSRMRRDDIASAVKTMSVVTIWRQADAANRLSPDAPIVGLRNTDEIVVPAVAFDAVTTDPAEPSPKRGALKIDETGRSLGTYSIKGTENWSAAS